jgi:hypothetical protein
MEKVHFFFDREQTMTDRINCTAERSLALLLLRLPLRTAHEQRQHRLHVLLLSPLFANQSLSPSLSMPSAGSRFKLCISPQVAPLHCSTANQQH